jgi:hypothetical protein
MNDMVIEAVAEKIADVVIERRWIDANSPYMSDAARGDAILEGLTEKRKIVEFSANPRGRAVLTQEQQIVLSALGSEHQVVAFLTNVFEEIFANDNIAVVNSEEYRWLGNTGKTQFDKKPDVLFCLPAFYTPRPPWKNSDETVERLRHEKNRFGVLSDWELRDCLGAIGEAKLSLGSGKEAFGQILAYAWHIGNRLPTSELVVLLFDRTEFWKIACLGGSPTSVIKCKWTEMGSRELFRDAPLESPWETLLKEVSSICLLTLEPGSFLGFGASGRVFRFLDEQRIPRAVKIVSGNDEISNLQEECKLLMDAHSKCPENVIGVERPVVELRQGAALVLSQVGTKLRRKDFARIMRSLEKLHVKDIIHGDARLANVVDVEGRVMWLDFRHSRPLPTIQQKILDLESLLKSLLSPTSHSRNIITPIAQAYDGNNIEEIIRSFRQPMQATLSKIPVWRH